MQPVPLRILALVAERLKQLNIEYLVSGAIALGVYGVPRSTAAIDAALELSGAVLDSFVRAFERDFSCDRDEVLEAIGIERRSICCTSRHS